MAAKVKKTDDDDNAEDAPAAAPSLKSKDGKEGPVQIKMLVFTTFMFFTMQQYYLRSSHRQSFNSLQFGGVCPGKALCNAEVEWLLMILDNFAAQTLGFLLLPMFTLNYKSSQVLSMKQLQIKNIKKFKAEQDQKDADEDATVDTKKSDEKHLYDADHDDFDSSDLGED